MITLGTVATLKGARRLLTSSTAWAALLDSLQTETDGMVLYFTDPTYPRALVRDTTTPANNFNGNANTSLTNTAPSAKWITNVSGLLESGTTLRCDHSAAGVPLGVLSEEARTNLVLYNRDLTNAAWTASNITPAKTATGPDGVANSATTLTATAGNATILQSITSGSAARITSCRIKRRTGSGTIEMTQDNGSTWAAVTVTSSWTRVNIAAATLANPIVGLRIVTSGDAIDVDFFQHEVGSFITSDIATTSAIVTRAQDQISLATSAFPFSATAGTIILSASRSATNYGGGVQISAAADGNEKIDIGGLNDDGYMAINDGGVAQFARNEGVTENLNIYAAGATAKSALAYAANDFAYSVNGSTAATDGTGTLPTVDTLYVGTESAASGGREWGGHIKYIKYLPYRVSNANLALESA